MTETLTAERLKLGMERRGLTDQTVSSYIGVHPTTVKNWRLGQKKIPEAKQEDLRAILRVFPVLRTSASSAPATRWNGYDIARFDLSKRREWPVHQRDLFTGDVWWEPRVSESGGYAILFAYMTGWYHASLIRIKSDGSYAPTEVGDGKGLSALSALNELKQNALEEEVAIVW